MTPDLALFATQLFSSVDLLPVWRGSVRQEVKAPEPNRDEVWVLVALFDGSIQKTKKSQPHDSYRALELVPSGGEVSVVSKPLSLRGWLYVVP